MGTLKDNDENRVAILSTPFDVLLADLARAKDLYESGDEAARAGAIVSAEAVTRFLMAFRSVADSGLCRPLVALCAALKDLDDGVPSTLLAPLKLGSRAGSSCLRQILKGYAACAADTLYASGLKREAADKAVADELWKMGVIPGRQGKKGNQGHTPLMTARTIRGWSGNVEADVGRRTLAAQSYDEMKKIYDPVIPCVIVAPDSSSRIDIEKTRNVILFGLQSMVSNYRGVK